MRKANGGQGGLELWRESWSENGRLWQRVGGVYDLRDMRVHVLYFGVLKDLLGTAEETVEVGHGATVAELLSLSALRASNLRTQETSLWTSLAVAVNREYAGPAVVLAEGDEVALLPPVSGGWGRA